MSIFLVQFQFNFNYYKHSIQYFIKPPKHYLLLFFDELEWLLDKDSAGDELLE